MFVLRGSRVLSGMGKHTNIDGEGASCVTQEQPFKGRGLWEVPGSAWMSGAHLLLSF